MDKKKLRDLLESDVKEVTLTLTEFIRMCDDDELTQKNLFLMEETLEKIAAGAENPEKLAKDTLAIYRGD